MNSLPVTDNRISPELLVLDPDTKEISIKSLMEIRDSMSFLQEMVQKDECTVSIRHNTLGVARAEFRRMEKFLGADSDINQEHELRLKMLREANTEVHRLRQELGKGATVEAIGNKLTLLNRTIYNWWQSLGFSYSKCNILSNGSFNSIFTTSLDRYVGSFEEKPVTAKANKKKKHEELGKELQLVRSDELYILDNPNNREWISKKLYQRFPKCDIYKWESRVIFKSSDFHISHVEANIPITDIELEEKT